VTAPTDPPTPGINLGDFQILPENRSAVRAVKSLGRAALLGKRAPVCPLVLHGQPGTGKTHLTTALLASLTLSDAITARSVTASDLARPDSLGHDTGFADPDLQACDVLILEDIQHLPERGADAACELLDSRSRHSKPLIVTTGISPAALTHLPRRLTSRLAAGLVVQLEPLGPMSRRRVLATAASSRKLRLEADALDWLATQTTGTGLRAALGQVQNLAQVAKKFPGPLTRADVENTLAGTGQPTLRGVGLDAIIKRVAAAFGVTEAELLGTSRLRGVVVPRQVAIYLARELTALSLPRIGAAFSRDHSTVLHACRKIDEAMPGDERLAATVRQLRGELG